MSRTRNTLVSGAALLLVTGALAAQSTASDELFPPNAKPGECYTRLFVPATYETLTQEVLVKEAAERLEIVPASYETVEETVLVEEASSKLEVIPAEYDWVEETVMVKPARTKIVEVPAEYSTTTEQILDMPAHTAWKTGRGPIERVDNSTGEILCLVEVPATYKTVEKRILAKPATTREEAIPAEYKTVRRRVMTKPPTTREIEIPAKHETVRVTKLARQAEVKRIEIPARHETVTTRKKISEGRMAWSSVLCETNTTPDLVSKIQSALTEAGYPAGAIDGRLGSATMNALRSFQRANGLPEGSLTTETLGALGL